MPVEPPPTSWLLPAADAADETEIVGVGADLEPGTVLAAYRGGLFPMRVGRGGPVAWWSPDPRGILPLDHFHESRSRVSDRVICVAKETNGHLHLGRTVILLLRPHGESRSQHEQHRATQDGDRL